MIMKNLGYTRSYPKRVRTRLLLGVTFIFVSLHSPKEESVLSTFILLTIVAHRISSVNTTD